MSRRALVLLAAVEAVTLIAALAVYQCTRAVPGLAVTTDFPGTATVPAGEEIPWPEEGQAALAIDGLGLVAEQPDGAQPQPIASTTKMMTALLILEDHPIGPDEPGPTIEITEQHAEAYLDAIFNDESAVEVREGENLTERQLLDGMLVASANNYARIAAAWDAGSEEAFVAKMNARARELGMTTTSYTDVAGLSPENVSTARDLLVLAQAAMANETFAAIVRQEEVALPVAGIVASTNALIGTGGVVGIKTGETDEAGACLVFAADVDSPAGPVRIYGVVLGQTERQDVFDRSAALIEAAAAQVKSLPIARAGEEAGYVVASWGAQVALVTEAPVAVTAWPGQQFEVTVETVPLDAPAEAGEAAGELVVRREGEVIARAPIVTAGAIDEPGLRWRLLRD